MIASVRGKLGAVHADSLIIDVGGIGLRVYCVRALLMGKARAGQEIVLHTHMWVRENDIALYGFETAEQLDLFALLVGVNGIGPRTALAALSALSAEALRQAIVREDVTALTQIPGVGAKTARRLILDLRERLQATVEVESLAAPAQGDVEVVNALTALGYSVAEATAVLDALPEEAQALDERILAALRALGSL